jgi:hypothetical protein
MGMDGKISTTTTNPKDVVTVDTSKVKSPETYFGSSRNQYFADGIAGRSGEQTLTVPANIYSNRLYLSGTWNITPEYAESKSVGSVIFNYEAKNVYITAGSKEGVEVEIYKDDVFVKKVLIKDETLYPLIQDTEYGKHTLHIVVPKAGLQAFTFTFG